MPVVDAFRGSGIFFFDDDLPELAFYMVGGIDEVLEKAEKLKAKK
jgi:F0F1-type ATP synthase beta subunit